MLCCNTICTFSSGCGLAETEKAVRINVKVPAITFDVAFINPDVQSASQFLKKRRNHFPNNMTKQMS